MCSDCFEHYTSLWLSKTNRGGLTQVNDTSFWLCQEIELVVYNGLKRCYAGMEELTCSKHHIGIAIRDEDIT